MTPGADRTVARAEGIRGFHDAIAPEYDRMFDRPGPGRWVRERVQKALLAAFSPGDSVLELNCGTGTDAVFLAEHGIRVTATDISPAMVAATAAKARARGVEALVRTEVVDAAEIALPGGGPFSGAYSNFDGLNYLEDIGAFAGKIGGLLSPGAPLLCMVLNRICLWEVLYFAGRLDPRRALRRARRRGEELSGPHVPLKLYFPGEFASRFARDFRLKGVHGFGLLLPPAGFGRLYRTRESLLRAVEPWDARIAGMFPLRNLCDHYLIELRRLEGR